MSGVTLYISAIVYDLLALVFATIPATLWQIVGSRVALVVPSGGALAWVRHRGSMSPTEVVSGGKSWLGALDLDSCGRD